MKRNILLILVLGCALSCHKEKKENQQDDQLQSTEMSDASVFQLESRWVNQKSDTLQLSELQGNVTIIGMVYTHCEFACPRLVAGIQQIERSLKEKHVENIQYVLASIDPVRDDPERLAAFASENNLDEHWTLLTSDPETIQELAVVLDFKYKAINDLDFSHSNLITVLNKSGEIVYRHEGLSSNTEEAVKQIMKIL